MKLTGKDSASQPLTVPKRTLLVRSDMILLVVLAAAAIIGPFLNGFQLFLLTLAAIYGIVAVGNNLLLGHAGLVSIGQGALCAIGAYACGIAARADMPLAATFILAILSSTLSGVIIGLPALRLSGHYLALVTLAAAIALAEIVVLFDSWTGGVSGISVTSHTLSAFQDFEITLAVLAAVVVGQSLLLSGRFGIALRLMRDSEHAAASVGIWVARYKLIAFAYAGALAGIAGALFVSATNYLAPSMFDVWLSIYFLVAVVLGGMNRPAGAVAGAALVAIIPQLVGQYQGMSSILFGFALLAAILLRAPYVRRLVAQFLHRLTPR